MQFMSRPGYWLLQYSSVFPDVLENFEIDHGQLYFHIYLKFFIIILFHFRVYKYNVWNWSCHYITSEKISFIVGI
jgi:hypothetical protein